MVGDGPTYVSFDIDSLDPAFAPGTGTPEVGGLSTREAMELVRGCAGLNIVGGDVVEVAPQYDATTNTAQAARADAVRDPGVDRAGTQVGWRLPRAARPSPFITKGINHLPHLPALLGCGPCYERRQGSRRRGALSWRGVGGAANVKIVVTGGAGFIGSAVCRYLVRETDAAVVNVDKLTYAANLRSLEPIANSPRYNFVRPTSATARPWTRCSPSTQPDAVMHLAAESHVDRSINGSDAFIRTNVLGTHSLLEAARAYWMRLPAERAQQFRFLHVSTDEVYGSLGPDGAFTETTAYDPSSPYSASKAAADHLACAWFRTFGFPVVISNCSNNYGPYHFPEKLIPLVILNALEGKPLPVYGDGSNVRDWLYVEDHARALHLILERGPARREIQRRRSQRAHQSRRRREHLRRARPAGAGGCGAAPTDHIRPGPSRPRPPLRHRRRQAGSASSAGRRERISTAAWPRRCAGISTIAPGGSRCATASMPASGSGWSSNSRSRRARGRSRQRRGKR